MLNLITQRYIIFFLILFFIAIAPRRIRGQKNSIPIKTLSAHFQREEMENKRLSKTKGSIYFSSPNFIWIRVKEPVNQHIKIDSTGMLIYYPGKNLVLNINSESSISLSFLTPFIASLRSDYGLSDLSYSIKDYKIKSDTLITEWHPPKNAKNKLGITTIKMISNKIIQVIISNPSNNASKQKFIFDKYVLINNAFWFPESVSIFKGTFKDQSFDKIKLENIFIDMALPDSITAFKFPENVTVKEYKW